MRRADPTQPPAARDLQHRHLTHRFVPVIPDRLEPGVLYLALEYGTATHSCCCGCGEEVVTPLTPTDWRITYDGETISLWPSVGNWNAACRSHYMIERGKVLECDAWTDEQILNERERDRREKRRYFQVREREESAKSRRLPEPNLYPLETAARSQAAPPALASPKWMRALQFLGQSRPLTSFRSWWSTWNPKPTSPVIGVEQPVRFAAGWLRPAIRVSTALGLVGSASTWLGEKLLYGRFSPWQEQIFMLSSAVGIPAKAIQVALIAFVARLTLFAVDRLANYRHHQPGGLSLDTSNKYRRLLKIVLAGAIAAYFCSFLQIARILFP